MNSSWFCSCKSHNSQYGSSSLRQESLIQLQLAILLSELRESRCRIRDRTTKWTTDGVAACLTTVHPAVRQRSAVPSRAWTSFSFTMLGRDGNIKRCRLVTLKCKVTVAYLYGYRQDSWIIVLFFYENYIRPSLCFQ